MSDDNLTKILLKLIENIKDELLLFSIAVIALIGFFPEQRLVIIFIYIATSIIYAVLKYNQKLDKRDLLNEFSSKLSDTKNWEKKFERKREFWVYKKDPLFHIESGEKLAKKFNEPWMKKYPDMNNNYSFKVYLKHTNTVIEDFAFVALDGVRYIVPLPESDGKHYFYKKNSLKFKTANVIGQFYQYKDINEFAKDHKIKVE